MDGTINSLSNITATGNISGNYILGNGSQLAGVTKNAFGQILISGESNVDASGEDDLTLVASGDITLATDAANNTITIGGSGSGYGNANVTDYLASGASTGDIDFTGNLFVQSANSTLSVDNYDGNVTSGTGVDTITFISDPGLYNGEAVLFSGTTNANITFLNGNVYYVLSAGGGSYKLYTDEGTVSPLTSGLSAESPSGLDADIRNEDNRNAYIYGNLYVTTGGTMHTNAIKPYTSGGTFSMTGIRASDVGIGDYFMPDTGGTVEGAVLTAHSDGAATFDVGFDIQSSSAVDLITVEEARNSSVGPEERYKKARGSVGSETVVSNNDRILESEYYGHDGTSYQMTFGEHVYVDGDADLSVGTGIVPLTKEWYTFTGGNVSAGFVASICKMTADRTIIF